MNVHSYPLLGASYIPSVLLAVSSELPLQHLAPQHAHAQSAHPFYGFHLPPSPGLAGFPTYGNVPLRQGQWV